MFLFSYIMLMIMVWYVVGGINGESDVSHSTLLLMFICCC